MIISNGKDIRLFLTDCDGCLTDGGMYYSEKGDELKKFNTRDGMGFSILRKLGIRTGIITGENVELNRRRADKLKLDYYVPGCKDKLKAAGQLCSSIGITLDNVLYIGDDMNSFLRCLMMKNISNKCVEGVFVCLEKAGSCSAC